MGAVSFDFFVVKQNLTPPYEPDSRELHFR
jgi:hypothetical protein